MQRKWLAFVFAGLLAGTGLMIHADAAAQQRPKAGAPKAAAKKAPARKAAPKATKAAPKVTTVPAGILIPPGANTLGAHAALYAAYANDVNGLSVGSITTGRGLTVSTERIARHLNSDRLALGIIAYGAAWAASEPEFVTEVRKAEATMGRDALIARLRSDITFARSLPGGEQAAQSAARVVLADAARIQTQGDAFKQAAYDWQRFAWAKASTADSKARNAALRALVPPPPLAAPSVTFSTLPDANPTSQSRQVRTQVLQRGLNISTPAAREAIVLTDPIRPYSPIDRMVAVAALTAIGAPSDRKEDTEALMRDPRLVSCVNSSRLNMQMCNAATKQPYERSFCLAEHPLGEIAKCMAKVVR
ncbi:hypothetical protein PbB2_01209 [Candidatus Phycosocius bacilliformis]|uniref:Uncharacterized protein n=1 Tax=Candidatus Phycosocius bacilliformis TaxID=1445552 RepID=A0A2P2E8Z6_9PROT|nr:hypothetical protein [Candidatus Phycosocius bacilliformis]GBF57542.1 hypothetical protein PbB2_01209 [Candidatus Phycosocius bacilliformis]